MLSTFAFSMMWFLFGGGRCVNKMWHDSGTTMTAIFNKSKCQKACLHDTHHADENTLFDNRKQTLANHPHPPSYLTTQKEKNSIY